MCLRTTTTTTTTNIGQSCVPTTRFIQFFIIISCHPFLCLKSSSSAFSCSSSSSFYSRSTSTSLIPPSSLLQRNTIPLHFNSRRNISSSSKNRSSSKITMAHMDSPSAQRNKGPIWSVLRGYIPNSSNERNNLNILEIAAGCGVHTIHFTLQITNVLKQQGVTWYPSDPDETSRNGIEQNVKEASFISSSSSSKALQESIYLPPLSLTLDQNGIMENDTRDFINQSENMDVITCINMIHISPWEATIGLFKVANQKLKQGGILYCYGPYKENGTAVESNL